MSRDQFEAWYMDNWGFTEDDIETLFERSPDCPEDYYRLGVRLAHHSWQAATSTIEAKWAALAAELKQSQIDAGCYKHGMEASNARLVQVVAENAALKSFGDKLAEMHNDLNGEGTGIQGRAEVACQQVALEVAMEEFDAIETPATDAFLAEVRASTIPEGYVLVPQEMHLSPEAMEGICFHCGDGGHNFGEFTDGTLFFGEVDYGDGVKVHGLHIATADYPEEGCATICEFAAQLRQDANTAELVAAAIITKVGE
ncbi:hypothetical protein [Leclercia adecarboxylata]|uniref:hypothetical protein n=1 Tax=Leclercia adecarboxylata TaxID=83655 RepID=UPI002B28B5E9|nr:hypothetical protein NRF19_23490 [Leclercia adecarboxylata]